MIDPLAEAGELVELLGHRLVFDDVDETHGAVDVGENGVRVRIPGEDHLVALHLAAVGRHHDRAERNLETRRDGRASFARRLDVNLAFVRGDDLLALGVGDDDETIAVFDDTGDLRLARRLLGDTRRRSTDVEGAQRELRARLADRLRGNDADGLTEVHDVHRGQVAAVAHAAETALRLTGEDGADLDHLDARLLDLRRLLFVDQLTSLDDQRAASRLVELVRILDIFTREVADDALGQRLDHVLAFLQRATPRAPGSYRNPLP